MGKKNTLRQYLLENGDSAEADIILRQLYEGIKVSDDDKLADRKFDDFARRTGLERHVRLRRFGAVLVKLAACLALPLLVISVWALVKIQRADVQWLQETTSIAQTREVTLSDGTVVTLQPCSQLYYPESFFGKQRRVILSGEAFLDVAKDRRKQFVVSAGDLNIAVHGTRFNVCSFPENEEDEVALLEGSVEVRLQGKKGSVFLAPGQMLKYDKTEGTIEHRGFAINYYEEVLKAGGLQFNNERLADIVATLNRYFDANIVVEDSSLASERYLASFINGENLDEILAALNAGGQFKITPKDKIIYITK